MQVIEQVIARIRPALQSDGGDMEFVKFDQTSGVLSLKFKGACAHCPIADITFRGLVESQIKCHCPEVKEIELV